MKTDNQVNQLQHALLYLHPGWPTLKLKSLEIHSPATGGFFLGLQNGASNQKIG